MINYEEIRKNKNDESKNDKLSGVPETSLEQRNIHLGGKVYDALSMVPVNFDCQRKAKNNGRINQNG